MNKLFQTYTKGPILVLLALLMLLFSCSREEDIPNSEEKSVTVSLIINDLDQQRAPLYSGEASIERLRIFVFNANGFIDAQKFFQSTEADFNNPFELKARTGTKKIVLIANEAASLSASLNTIIRYNDLLPLLQPTIDADNLLATPLPMTAELNNVNLVATGANTFDANLLRSLAKISLDIKQNTAADDQIQITKVDIKRNTTASTLLPLNAAINNFWNWSKSFSLNLVNNAPAEALIPQDAPLYVYENIGSLADTAGRATQIMVEAIYNGVATRYYAYVNDETTTADHQYSLHRNHHYKLTGTISKLGEFSSLLLSTEVLPWTLEPIQHDFLKPYIVSVDPATAFDPSVTNYATMDSPFVLKIKIKGGEGAIWKATLSNGLEFGLSTDGAATQGNADETEYTVKVLPLKDPGDTPRRTALFFTVGGKKVVLQGGSGEQYTDIIITQRAS